MSVNNEADQYTALVPDCAVLPTIDNTGAIKPTESDIHLEATSSHLRSRYKEQNKQTTYDLDLNTG